MTIQKAVLLALIGLYCIAQFSSSNDRMERKLPEEYYTRAAVVYMPNTKVDVFMEQLKWFLESAKYMRKYEQSNWRTDVVVVVSDVRIPGLDTLNCTAKKRINKKEDGGCRIVKGYQPLRSRKDDILHDYGYADSIDSLLFAWKSGALQYYDSILRSDMDTFLTPAFATWRPEQLVVGDGGYCFEGQITCSRLKRVARDLRMTTSVAMVENIGSTWYGNTDMILECANTTMNVMRYLSRNEFTKYDKDPVVIGAGKNWPGWHYGVLLLYAGQIAINYCARPEAGGFVIDRNNLDFPTTSEENPTEHAHLHTWQNDDTFSKFAFNEGLYQNVSVDDLDMNNIQDYAMYLAIVANQS